MQLYPGKLPGEQAKDCEPTGRLLGQQVSQRCVCSLCVRTDAAFNNVWKSPQRR